MLHEKLAENPSLERDASPDKSGFSFWPQFHSLNMRAEIKDHNSRPVVMLNHKSDLFNISDVSSKAVMKVSCFSDVSPPDTPVSHMLSLLKL